MNDIFIRDKDNVLHVVALSGGHDSTALSLWLKDQNPLVPYNYVCTPTGDELPTMIAHWLNLGQILGRRVYPIMAGTLDGIIREEKMLPNFRARFCTRRLKIEPYIKFLKKETLIGPVVSYVGLRADEEGRIGGIYDNIPGVETKFPLRELGFTEKDVQLILRLFSVICPNRTDCGKCYHQRLGEWYEFWRDYPILAKNAVDIEAEIKGTFRTPGRDNWPVGLKELFEQFSSGNIPIISLNRIKRERMETGQCRVCSL